MAGLLKRGLEEEGYSVLVAVDGEQGLELAKNAEPDAIILDVMLPTFSGLEVARRLREGRNQVPILMLTARDAPRDVVAGLDIGADDYLTKPFSFEVLLARLRAISRRNLPDRSPRLQIADLVIDPATREAFRSDEKILLTRTEFSLLEYLMRRPGRVVARQTLIEAVWGHGSDIESNTLDAFISLVRSKLEALNRKRLIHTVRGVGYCLREEEP